MTSPEFSIADRPVGAEHPPLVIAEIGINHEGDEVKARRMINDAAAAGCECVKFQTHVVEDEMIENDVVPGNADEPIYTMMQRCALDADTEARLKAHAESLGLIFLSTPFSRAAASRLHALDVPAYKIGSGECNNYPLIEFICSLGKPVILSTGMNNLDMIEKSVAGIRAAGVPYALLHCTSVYPTPYDKVRLGAMKELTARFPDAVIGLSDHSLSIYPCLGAVALGASILERHFTSDKSWPGPDIEVSMNPAELGQLVIGSRAIHAAGGGAKEILDEEAPTIRFAYASVVTIEAVDEGAELTRSNIWVKRPGTGEIQAEKFGELLGRRTVRAIAKDTQIRWSDLA